MIAKSRYDGICDYVSISIVNHEIQATDYIGQQHKSPLHDHRILANLQISIGLKMAILKVGNSEETIQLKGQLVDTHTRCRHYHSTLDIIAIKFKCCDAYFPCYKCHQESESHDIIRWKKLDLDTEKVILCGSCYNLLYYQEYSADDNICLYCNSGFNPNCSLHYGLYFELWLQFAYYFIMLQYGEKWSYCT